jgi:hypothetical protein
MKHRVLWVVVCLLVLPSLVGRAEEYEPGGGLPCGAIGYTNRSHQFGQYAWVEYIVETLGALDICGQWFATTSAYVVGVPNSGMIETSVVYSQVRRQIPVPAYDRTYQVNGRHFASSSLIFIYADFTSVSHATVGKDPREDFPPPDEGGGEQPCSDCEDAGSDDDWSPIIIDVARDGYRLTSLQEGVRFDLDADGVPEQVSWTRHDSDDAFLAMDRNGNGTIDSGAELFGNGTPAFPGSEVTTPNGFEALKFLELPDYGRNLPDETLDANDASFSRLLLWRDANHNGISEPDELVPARAAGVVAIPTDYKAKRRVDRFGNQFRQRGTVIWQDGADFCFDVWLRRRD